MAAFNNKAMRKQVRSEGTYSSEEIRHLTLDDGPRVSTLPNTDIRRPVCVGIDVHKEILMATVCRKDPLTLGALFYVRQFTSFNSNIRRMTDWLKSYGVPDVCMESAMKYWLLVYNILEHNGLKTVLTHPKYVKQAKGRRTAFRDAIHIANLFRMDLVETSFTPCRYQEASGVVPLPP